MASRTVFDQHGSDVVDEADCFFSRRLFDFERFLFCGGGIGCCILSKGCQVFRFTGVGLCPLRDPLLQCLEFFVRQRTPGWHIAILDHFDQSTHFRFPGVNMAAVHQRNKGGRAELASSSTDMAATTFGNDDRSHVVLKADRSICSFAASSFAVSHGLAQRRDRLNGYSLFAKQIKSL